jgi:hypothetical protein
MMISFLTVPFQQWLELIYVMDVEREGYAGMQLNVDVVWSWYAGTRFFKNRQKVLFFDEVGG